MRRLVVAAVVAVFVVPLGVAQAADKAADPTGTWKWKAGRAGMEREMTLKLKMAGGKLTGTLAGPSGKGTPISDASYKDGKVAFTVNIDRGGMKFSIKYNGTVSDDTIKGKVEFGTNMRDWVAKRAK